LSAMTATTERMMTAWFYGGAGSPQDRATWKVFVDHDGRFVESGGEGRAQRKGRWLKFAVPSHRVEAARADFNRAGFVWRVVVESDTQNVGD
jgi:hypothetical protein